MQTFSISSAREPREIHPLNGMRKKRLNLKAKNAVKLRRKHSHTPMSFHFQRNRNANAPTTCQKSTLRAREFSFFFICLLRALSAAAAARSNHLNSEHKLLFLLIRMYIVYNFALHFRIY